MSASSGTYCAPRRLSIIVACRSRVSVPAADELAHVDAGDVTSPLLRGVEQTVEEGTPVAWAWTYLSTTPMAMSFVDQSVGW